MFSAFSSRRTGTSLLATTPNRWDWALLPIVLSVLVALAFGAAQMSRPFVLGQPTPISLDPGQLPYYLLRTMLRMFMALACSLLFSFVFATMAAKYRAAERVSACGRKQPSAQHEDAPTTYGTDLCHLLGAGSPWLGLLRVGPSLCFTVVYVAGAR